MKQLRKRYEGGNNSMERIALCLNTEDPEQKELHELHFKDVNIYLQENYKIQLLENEWEEIVSPEAFIQKRKVYGGPSKKEMERMIKNRKESFQKEEEVFEKEKQRILQAETDLNMLTSNYIES